MSRDRSTSALARKPEADRGGPEEVSSGGAARPSIRAIPSGQAATLETAQPENGTDRTVPSAREAGSPVKDKVADTQAPAKNRRPLLFVIGAAVLAAAAWFGYDYITVGRFIVSTDDAYVGAYMSVISPKVPANVAEVPVVDNQTVKMGDTLVRLDDVDYKLALEQAQTKLNTQRATIATFDAQITAGEAQATQARAQLESAKATVVRTEADYTRTASLAAKDYSTKASLDAAIASRDSARAQVKAQDAAIASADANIKLLHAQRDEAEKVAKELEVAVAKAERDLSFTVIRAPFNGVVGNRSVQVGDYVTAGKRLIAVVPLDKVYVDANLKETQLAPVVVGQTANVEVDALNGKVLKGTVESVAPASGSQFSLLPPENATGNFTKIVQRVPVRIAIPASEAQGQLRPGLSVVVGIDTRTTPKTDQQRASN